MISIRRVINLARARTLEFLRDRRSLGWSIAFPFLVMVGFGFAFSGNSSRPLLRVGVLETPGTSGPRPIEAVQFISETNHESALESLRKHQRDLVIDPISATYWVNPESSASRFAERLLVSGVLAGGGQGGWEMQAAAGSPIRYVDWLLPGLVGMNLMFSALFGVGFVIVRYRKNGVLKRLQVTPTHPFEFLLAQVASRVLVILGTALLILYGGAFLTGAQNKGALLDIVVLLVCGSLAMISIGVLVASRTGSEELAGGLVQVVSWPMMLFSGIWFSIDELHPWFIRAADLFPLTHLLRALRAIWLDGSGLVQADGVVIRSALILLAFAVVFLLAGASMFRWNDDS